MVRKDKGFLYGAAVTGLLGLSFLGWTHFASAQNDPGARPGFGQQPPGGGRMMMGGGGASVAASGDWVYVLRGNTLHQMRASDLSITKQAQLPMPAGGRPGDPGAPPPPNP